MSRLQTVLSCRLKRHLSVQRDYIAPVRSSLTQRNPDSLPEFRVFDSFSLTINSTDKPDFAFNPKYEPLGMVSLSLKRLSRN